jgi:prepilin-type N-terminal cleavage/methylation domain-containing protein
MKRRRGGFTLFELILAIALAAVLLTLIGTAIHLYLRQVDAGRARVEEAQLARTILAMIADDIRATTIYQPQDTSSIAQLMASTSNFDVDSIDKPNNTNSATSGPGGTTGTSGVGGVDGATTLGSSSSSGGSAADAVGDDSTTTMPLGVNGQLEELYVDVTRLPKQEELFNTTTGYTNAPSPNDSGSSPGGAGTAVVPTSAPPADLKTVRYYVRPGEAVEAGSASATPFDPAAQLRVGGLVRQEIGRSERVFAEQNGGSDVLNSGESLLAPEVVHIEFRYFDGSQTLDVWDMRERKSLPVAIEACIWLRSPNATNEPVAATYDLTTLGNTAREYRQVVFLPAAELITSHNGAGSGGSSENSSASSGASSSTSGFSSGSGSGFGVQ